MARSCFSPFHSFQDILLACLHASFSLHLSLSFSLLADTTVITYVVGRGIHNGTHWNSAASGGGPSAILEILYTTGVGHWFQTTESFLALDPFARFKEERKRKGGDRRVKDVKEGEAEEEKGEDRKIEGKEEEKEEEDDRVLRVLQD